MKHILVALLIMTSLPLVAKETNKIVRIVALGDSLTEGYGLSKKEAWPHLLEESLRKKGHNIKVVNAGVSGSTTASALRRLQWQLKAKPNILILALGANDGLRGFKVKASTENLEKTIKLAQAKNIKVLLTGMMLPANYGKKYRQEFQAMFKALAKKYQVAFMPFLLKDVATVAKLNLPDRIHPNAEGYKVVARNLLPYVEKLL